MARRPARYRLALTALVLVGLAGCVSAPPPRPAPQAPVPPPVQPAPPAPVPPAQPLPRPVPPPAVIRPGPPPSAPPAATTPAPQPATDSLLALADRQAAAGDVAQAAAQLERALRIRPQDPLLWHKLAWLRLRNGEFEQAAALAARSDSLAGNNAALRAENRRIADLAQARQRP